MQEEGEDPKRGAEQRAEETELRANEKRSASGTKRPDEAKFRQKKKNKRSEKREGSTLVEDEGERVEEGKS